LAFHAGALCKFEVSWTGIEYSEAVFFLRSEKKIEVMGYSFEFMVLCDKDGVVIYKV
jgi:hypothetical protein